MNDFAEWEKQAQAARAAAEEEKAQAIKDAQEKAAQEDAGRKIFADMDKDGSGGLDARELKALLSSLGRKVTKKQVAASHAEMDLNGDGDISLDEFIVWWCHLDEEQRSLLVQARAKSKAKAADSDDVKSVRRATSKHSDSGKTIGAKKKPKKKKKKAK